MLVFQEDEWAETCERSKKNNSLSDIGEHWIENYFCLFLL
jgi:hypothetical protein